MTTAQRRREKARANGLCGECCHRPAMPGRRCDTCREYMRIYALRNNNNHSTSTTTCIDICLECQAIGFHRSDCRDAARSAA